MELTLAPKMAMRARFKRHGGPDWVEFVWEDNFTGWQQLRFDLRSPDSVSGVVDWTDVSQILFRPLADLSATLRFDNLVVGTGSQQDAITEGPVKEVEGKIDVLAPAGR